MQVTLTTASHPVSDAMRAVTTLQIERASGLTMTPGVSLDVNGDIVASAAAIDQARSITMVTGATTSAPATVVGIDVRSDVAVIHVAGVRTSGRPAAASTRIGDAIRLTPSDPLDRDRTSAGRVSATNETLRQAGSPGEVHSQIIVSTATPMPAASVVTSEDGTRLVGLVNPRGNDGGNELVFAIPMTVALNVGQQLATTGHVRRTGLGIVTADERRGTTSGRARVEAVAVDSAAEHAGIRVGDVVVDIEREPVSSSDDITGALARFAPGDIVSVLVERGGDRHIVKVALSEVSPDT